MAENRKDPRPAVRTLPAVPLSVDHEVIDAEPNANDLWQLVLSYSDIPERGEALLPGRPRRRRALFEEFRNFVRQARSYYVAAEPVRDASAALLYYYSFLNLAKAELLRTHPEALVGTRIDHGLSYRPGRFSRPMTAQVRVRQGVFPLLFEKRTDERIPAGESLPVDRLMSRATHSYGGGEDAGAWSTGTLARVHHTIAWDATHVWSMLAVNDADAFLAYQHTERTWNAALQEVAPPRMWDRTFRIDLPHLRWRFFESSRPIALETEGDVTIRDLQAALRQTVGDLRLIVEPPYDLGADGLGFPSLYKGRPLFLPPSLCNYVLMYYCSSLARYEPSKLDGQLHGMESWGLHHFVQNTAVRLLQDAYAGIAGTRPLFTGYRGMRV